MTRWTYSPVYYPSAMTCIGCVSENINFNDMDITTVQMRDRLTEAVEQASHQDKQQQKEDN